MKVVTLCLVMLSFVISGASVRAQDGADGANGTPQSIPAMKEVQTSGDHDEFDSWGDDGVPTANSICLPELGL